MIGVVAAGRFPFDDKADLDRLAVFDDIARAGHGSGLGNAGVRSGRVIGVGSVGQRADGVEGLGERRRGVLRVVECPAADRLLAA